MNTLRIALILFLLSLMSAPMVSADPPDPPRLGPAMFEYVPDCWVFDMRGPSDDDAWYYIENCSPTISLITNSKTGMLHWTAHGQLPIDDPNIQLPEKGAYQFTYENSGFVCWWEEGVVTTNYAFTLTSKGKFIASCHFRPDKWQP